jgi:hypothetical protein
MPELPDGGPYCTFTHRHGSGWCFQVFAIKNGMRLERPGPSPFFPTEQEAMGAAGRALGTINTCDYVETTKIALVSLVEPS